MVRTAVSIALVVAALGCSDSSSKKAASTADADVADSGSDRTRGETMKDAGTRKDAGASGSSGGAPSPSRDAAVSGERPQPNAGKGGSAGADAAPPQDRSDSGTPPAEPPSSGDDAGSPPDASASRTTCVGTTKLDTYASDPRFCVHVFASGVVYARGLVFAPNGDLFVISNNITVLWDADKNGESDPTERATFAQQAGLNHGIAFSRDAKFLYASSPTTVYRWAYASGQHQAQGAAQIVIAGMPDAGHATRTLQFDSQGRLIVSIGSASNLDTEQSDWDDRSQVRRFTIPEMIPDGGLPYAAGEKIATGMRNEVGIYVDADDRIWSVENERDNLMRADLGGDIHNDNPGEEINLIDGKGPVFYGYPRCFSELNVANGMGRGTQWADQSLPSMQATDDFCRDPLQVRSPVWVMPAHWAPLGVIRYTGHALPANGDLLVGSHGSWNRDTPTGRVIGRARIEGSRITAFDILIGEKGPAGELRQGTWAVRPVDLRQGPDEALYVSDDMGGRVLKIGYEP